MSVANQTEESQYETVLYGTEGATVDQRGTEASVDAAVENKANLGVIGVRETAFDQSNSKIQVKGSRGTTTKVNHFEGCENVNVIQDNVFHHVQGGGENSATVVDYVNDTQGMTYNVSNSTTIIQGGRAGTNSITAGRIIQGNSTVVVNENNHTTIIGS